MVNFFYHLIEGGKNGTHYSSKEIGCCAVVGYFLGLGMVRMWHNG
jgi:hypothetical protein